VTENPTSGLTKRLTRKNNSWLALLTLHDTRAATVSVFRWLKHKIHRKIHDCTVMGEHQQQNKVDLGRMAEEVLYIGTTDGVWAWNMDNPETSYERLGLEGSIVNQVACAADGTLIVAVPKFGIMHHVSYKMDPSQCNNSDEYCGLWKRCSHEGSPFRRIAQFDARSVAVCPTTFTLGKGGNFLVGTEPAQVHLYSTSEESLNRIDKFDTVPNRELWTFPVKPHRPHVLSLDFQQEYLFAGVEEGGVIRSEDGGSTWQESNEGELDIDIHAARADPHSTRVFAVTGLRVAFRTRQHVF
jgi:hypothetical protein